MSDGATVLWVGDGSVTGGDGEAAEADIEAAEADAKAADPDTGAVEAVDRLERAGHAVVRSTPGSVADALAGERPDCAVCDTGPFSAAEAVETVETVAGSGPPVVVFARGGGESLAARTVAAGADEYVPASADDSLVAAVDRALDRGRGAGDDHESVDEETVEGGAARRLDALFAATPDPVVEYAFEDGEPVVESVNRAFVETFGYDRGVAVGEPLNDLVVPDDREAEAASLDERVRAGERLQVETERETTDGTRTFLLRNVPVESGDRPAGYAVYVDVTDRKDRERRLREQNDRLNEFASVIGHDLRNPMGAVRHRIEMARRTGDDRHLEDALSALDRMDELLRDLLRMARQGEQLGRTEPVSLAEVARGAWDNVPTGESSLVVADDPTVVADRGRLTQLLENLFVNSVEHGSTSPASQAQEDADAAGPIEHGADDSTGTVEVRVGVGEDGCLFVEDDGRGIPDADRGDVFESGFTTSSEGTGYGLAIVRQVARAHGWEAAATESADGGARFEFRGVEFGE
ncbi:receiver/sensor box histidine kinase [Halosimplex halophilum]|uniref:receiver/sensor box histidine kinase n=1 Tax=Halosimplex halophilum TaxID=2559572 RepID=UPI00107FD3A7|nr:ATP-binding protein [Halosimplex halophilum]